MSICLIRVVFETLLGDTHRMQRYSSQRAVRLKFSYSNSQIKLESKQAIEKVVSASDPLEDAQPAGGFFRYPLPIVGSTWRGRGFLPIKRST
jgi:hypothetical protein